MNSHKNKMKNINEILDDNYNELNEDDDEESRKL